MPSGALHVTQHLILAVPGECLPAIRGANPPCEVIEGGTSRQESVSRLLAQARTEPGNLKASEVADWRLAQMLVAAWDAEEERVAGTGSHAPESGMRARG